LYNVEKKEVREWHKELIKNKLKNEGKKKKDVP
jgi:hypothetical protein